MNSIMQVCGITVISFVALPIIYAQDIEAPTPIDAPIPLEAPQPLDLDSTQESQPTQDPQPAPVPQDLPDVTIVEPPKLDGPTTEVEIVEPVFFTPTPQSVGEVDRTPLSLGDIKLNIPVTYAVVDRTGEILGLPFFAVLDGLNYPDFFLLSVQGPNELEGMSKQLFQNNFSERFTLEETRSFSGAPRKLALTIRGLENTYLVYLIPMTQPGSYLVAVAPLPEGNETYKEQADAIVKSATY